MQNMKLSKSESDSVYEVKPGDGPAYPYGLCLYLDNDTLAKLGYTSPPEVGAELMLQARVVVTSTGVTQQQDGDKEQRAELQITDMALSRAQADPTKVFNNSAMNP